jgi:hypothetical protein
MEKVKAPRRKIEYLPTKTIKNAFCRIPINSKTQNALADEMLVYVDETQILDLDKFPNKLKMSPYRFYKVAESNEYFAEALECAQYIISARIKDGWIHKDFDSKACSELLPEYNQAYRDWVCSKVTMAIQARNQANKTGNLTVVMDSVQTTAVVPERQKEDERFVGNSNQVESF